MKKETDVNGPLEISEHSEASYESFREQLKSHAQDDFRGAIALAEESFDQENEVAESEGQADSQEVSARELFFMARDMENKTLPLEEARQAVKTGLEAQKENTKTNLFLKSADLMLKVRDASKEDRRKLFYQHLKNLLVEWNQKKISEDDFFDEIVSLSSLAYESGVKKEAFRALEAVKTSLNSEMYFRAYSYLIQSVNNPGEALDRMKAVVEGAGLSEKTKGYEHLLVPFELNRDVAGVIDTLKKLKSLDEKMFAKNVGAAVWNLLALSKTIDQKPEEREILFALVQESEIKIEEMAKAGPIRDEQGYIEEPMVRLSLITAYTLLRKMEEAIAAFDRMEARAAKAREIIAIESEDLGSGKSHLTLDFEASQMEGKYFVRSAKNKIAQTFAEQGKFNLALEWTSKLDVKDWGSYSENEDVAFKKALFIKSTGGDPMPILKPFLFPEVKKFYSNRLREMANFGFLSKEVLEKQIELYADTIKIDLSERGWGYEFIELLTIAKEQKIAVPHTYELARHLADTPELMSESGRVVYLSRLASLESKD
jgi:hypothetical protein